MAGASAPRHPELAPHLPHALDHGERLAILHSSLGEGERAQEWERARSGSARVVLGPRSAVFAPVERLGVVVVDEEHDAAFKQEHAPRYNARDLALVRRVARSELKDTKRATGENVFTMMRRIGEAKAGLAADYAAQLARSAGKVVFFAKHVDVMDAAEETFARLGVRFS